MALAPSRVALVAVGYAVVAAVSMHPLIQQFTTHFPGAPGNMDVFGFLWNNWWIHEAFTRLHTTPLHTNAIFAPVGVDLRLHTIGWLYGLLSLPVFSWLGPVVTLNVQIIATAVLNGLALFTLARQVTRDDAAACVAGLLLATTPAINFHLDVGRPSCAALWTAILAIAALLRFLEQPTTGSAARLAAWLVATLLCDQQVAMFCAVWCVILVADMLLTRARSVPRPSLTFVLGVSAVVALPAYLFYWKPFMNVGGYTTPAASEAVTYSYPLRLLWTPSMLWKVYGTVMPVIALAAVWLCRRERRLWPWVIGAALCVAMSFGPVVHGTHVPLPFALLAKLPGFSQFRTPYRFQIPAALGLAMLVAMVIARRNAAVGRQRAIVVTMAVALCVLVDLTVYRRVSPMKVQTMPSEAVYGAIAGDPREGLLLEVPLGVRTGTDRIGVGEELSFYQPIHRKRLINGFLARAPLSALDYYRQSTALRLLAGDGVPAGESAADLSRQIRAMNVIYVVVHPLLMDAEWLNRVLAVLRAEPRLREQSSGDETIVFAVVTATAP